MTIQSPSSEIASAPQQNNPDIQRMAPEQDAITSFAEFEAKMDAELAAGPPSDDPPAKEPVATGGEPPANEEGAEAGEEGAETDEGTETPPPETKPKGKKQFSERIGELRRKQGEAERAVEAERERADRLERELAELKAGKQPAPAAAEEGEPDPEKFEYGVLDPAYMKAVREFDRAQLRKELESSRQTEAAQAQLAEKVTKHEELAAAYDAEVGDYVEKVVQGAQDGKWACSSTMNELILESDAGAKVAYHLASNPAESIRVSKMTPVEQAKWFGRKEAELSAPPSGKGEKPTAKVPGADPPATPVRGQGGKFAPKSDTADYASFEKNFKHLLESPSF